MQFPIFQAELSYLNLKYIQLCCYIHISFTFGEHFVSYSSVTYLIRWYFEILCYLPISIAFIIIKV
jgi:hypothetical protein